MISLTSRSAICHLLSAICLALFAICPSLAQVGISTEELPVQLTRPDASLKFRTLDASSGTPDDLSWRMMQDSRGFIWSGGFNGLVRYDGYDVKVYENDPDDETSIPADAVSAIVEAANGQIWIGTHDGDIPVARFDPKTERFRRFRTDSTDATTVTGGRAFAIFEDSRGDIWVGTAGDNDYEGGLNRFDPATETFPAIPTRSGRSQIVISESAVCIDSGGSGRKPVDRHVRKRTESIQPRHGRLRRVPGTTPDDDRSLSHNNGLDYAYRQQGRDQSWRRRRLWARCTREVLNEFEPATGTFKRFIHDPRNPTSHQAAQPSPPSTKIRQDRSG